MKLGRKVKTAALCAALGMASFLAFENARAASVPLRAGIWQGVAITTSSQVIIGPGSVLTNPVTSLSTFLHLENAGGGTICISFGAPATISGGVCAAGELTLSGAGSFRFFDTTLPTDSVYAIGSAATSLTVAGQ